MYKVIRKVAKDETLQYASLYRIQVEIDGDKKLDQFTAAEFKDMRDELYVQLAQKQLHLEDVSVMDPFHLNIVAMYTGHSIIAIMIIVAIAAAISVFGLKIMTDNIVEVQEVIEEIKPIALAGFGTLALVAVVVFVIIMFGK